MLVMDSHWCCAQPAHVGSLSAHSLLFALDEYECLQRFGRQQITLPLSLTFRYRFEASRAPGGVPGGYDAEDSCTLLFGSRGGAGQRHLRHLVVWDLHVLADALPVGRSNK